MNWLRGAAIRGLVASAGIVVLAGCRSDEAKRTAPGEAVSSRGAATKEPDHVVSARVNDLLYSEGLITNAEVNARMNREILAVDRDGAAADSVLREFDGWLDAWAGSHPDEVGRARLMVGNAGVQGSAP
jgi:hypothetical protein